MASSVAAVAGGIGGVVVVLLGVIFFVCFRGRKYSNRNSDSASSDPSAVGNVVKIMIKKTM